MPAPWYEACLESVRAWAQARSYEYRFIGDEIFTRLPVGLEAIVVEQPVVASDLARLILLQAALADGYERAVWVDADVLVIDLEGLVLPAAQALFGREVWIQPGGEAGKKLKTYRKVHNAFMAFCAGEPVLPFYRMSAERILKRYDAGAGPKVPQLIGPKLITLLHNAIGFDVLEAAGMLSPWVVRDLLDGGGAALDRFLAASSIVPQAVNLCGSSVRTGELSDAEMTRVIDRLQSSGLSP